MSLQRLAGTIEAKQLSLCSSSNRALSMQDKDVGVKPTGGSMTNVRAGLHFMQKNPMWFDSTLGLVPGKTSCSFFCRQSE